MADSLHPTPPTDDASIWTLTGLLHVTKNRVFPTNPDSLSDEHLRLMSTQQLRVLTNRTFRTLELPHPPYGSYNRYNTLITVLEEREHAARRSA